MARERIPSKPSEFRDQLAKASAGVPGEPNWPATGPSHPELDAS